jgi:hypothetical protein
MTSGQLHLMIQAAQASRWQQASVEQAVEALWRTGKWVGPPNGISPSRWRGMVLRTLLDLKHAPRSTEA